MRLFISLAAAFIMSATVLLACNPQTGNSQTGNNAQAVNTTSGATTTKVATTDVTTTQTSATQTPPGDGARRITDTDANEALKGGKAIIIDVRGEAAYKAGHIKGAKLIPAGEIEKHISELPKDKLIITYCS